jgi:hypothetical protein
MALHVLTQFSNKFVQIFQLYLVSSQANKSGSHIHLRVHFRCATRAECHADISAVHSAANWEKLGFLLSLTDQLKLVHCVCSIPQELQKI